MLFRTLKVILIQSSKSILQKRGNLQTIRHFKPKAEYKSDTKKQFKGRIRPSLGSFAGQLLRNIIYLEIALFVGTYLAWRRINTSQEYRYYLRNNYPAVLEVYYSIGETASDSKLREVDEVAFEKLDKAQKRK
jgi:hypothetical protein